MGGTKAGRVDEIPAADLLPAKDLLPAANGTYKVPDWAGTGCIGLRWDENRLLRQLVLQFPSAAQRAAGRLDPLAILGRRVGVARGMAAGQARLPEQIGSSLVWSLGREGFARGTQKVRWLFPGMKQPVVLAALSAYTRSIWNTVDVRIESTRPSSAPKAEIELYNGVILGPAGSSPYRRTWDPAKPLELKVRSSTSKRYKADRTVLRFQFPETAFAVAVEDLSANDCVYVPHAGLFVTRMPAPVALGEYLKKIAAQSSVLAQVHKQPDQDFARAMAVVHNPIQDLGPMMLSLACDNRKFVVHREGTVVFDEYSGPDDKPRNIPNQWQLVPRFGSGKNAKIARKLHGLWLPMPETTVTEGDVEYRQTTYVAPCGEAPSGGPAWLRERALGVAQYCVQNRGSAAADATLALTFAGAAKQPLQLQKVREGALVVTGGRVLARSIRARRLPWL